MTPTELPNDDLRDVAPPRPPRAQVQSGAHPDREPVEVLADVAEGTTLAHLVQDNFDLNKAIGGVRGILEGVIPVTLFSVIFGVTKDVRTAALTALASSAFFAVWRLLRRESLTQALGGMLGVGIGAFLAVRTGRAENFFAWSLVKNAGFTLLYAGSIAVRWPLVGVVLGFVYGELFHWREVPARYRVYVSATWLFAGMFALRLAVQLPLFLISKTSDAPWATTALGFASIPLGLPLLVVVAYLTWRIVSRVPPAVPKPPAGEGTEADQAPAEH